MYSSYCKYNVSCNHENIAFICATDPPSIGNILGHKVCATSLSISWDTYNKMCGISSQLVTITSSSSSARTYHANDKYNFTDLTSNTSYDVTVTIIHEGDQLTTRRATIKTLPIHRMFSIIKTCITI